MRSENTDSPGEPGSASEREATEGSTEAATSPAPEMGERAAGPAPSSESAAPEVGEGAAGPASEGTAPELDEDQAPSASETPAQEPNEHQVPPAGAPVEPAGSWQAPTQSWGAPGMPFQAPPSAPQPPPDSRFQPPAAPQAAPPDSGGQGAPSYGWGSRPPQGPQFQQPTQQFGQYSQPTQPTQQFGQPQYGQPQQPGYGQPYQGQQPQYGQSFGASSYGASSYGGNSYGSSSYGAQPTPPPGAYSRPGQPIQQFSQPTQQYGQPASQFAQPAQPPQTRQAVPPTGPAQAGGYGQFTIPAMSKPPLEWSAVAALATCWTGIIGLVLGFIAKHRVAKNHRRSKRLALAGIVASAAFILVWAIVITVLFGTGTIARWTASPQQGDVSSSRTVSASIATTGNCIAHLPPNASVSEVELVPCAQAHTAQVLSSHPLGDTMPAAADLAETAQTTCESDLAAIDSSGEFDSWYFAPSQSAWDAGTHNFVCIAKTHSGTTTKDLVNH